MALELSVNANFFFTKNNLALAGAANNSITVTGTNFINSTQLITTGATTVLFGANLGVASVGMIMLQNSDTTNYVDVDFNNDLTFPIRLGPATSTAVLGGFVMAYLGAGQVTVVKARANTASCNLVVSAVEA